jgi:hypothetical protein
MTGESLRWHLCGWHISFELFSSISCRHQAVNIPCFKTKLIMQVQKMTHSWNSSTCWYTIFSFVLILKRISRRSIIRLLEILSPTAAAGTEILLCCCCFHTNSSVKIQLVISISVWHGEFPWWWHRNLGYVRTHFFRIEIYIWQNSNILLQVLQTNHRKTRRRNTVLTIEISL